MFLISKINDKLQDYYDRRYRRKKNKFLGASCTCQNLKCICPCISGGLDSEGSVTRNVCFNHLCKKHGKDCIVR